MKPTRMLKERNQLKMPLITLAILMMAAMTAAASPAYIQAASPQKAAVTGLTVTDGANAGELNVSWDAHPEGAQEYRQAWTPSGQNFKGKNNTTWNAFPASESHTITGLNEDTTYKFKVRAKFASPPVSRWSQRITFTTAEAEADTPTPPAQVRDAVADQPQGDTLTGVGKNRIVATDRSRHP